jgi:WD40 repeat protein
VEELEKSLATAVLLVNATAQAAAAADDVFKEANSRTESLNAELEIEKSRLTASETDLAIAEQKAKQIQVLATATSAVKNLTSIATSDGSVLVFDSETHQLKQHLTGGFTEGVNGPCKLMFLDRWLLAISPGNADAAKVWDLAGKWQLAKTIGSVDGDSPFIDAVVSLDFSPDGDYLVTGGGEPSRSGELQVFETNHYELIKMFGDNHSDVIMSVKISPDGKYLASGGADRQIRVVDFPSGDNLRSLEGHTHYVPAITWQDNSRQLASASSDQTVKIWNVRGADIARTISVGAKEVNGLTFLGQGSSLAIATANATTRIYNADDGALLRTFSGSAGFLHSIASDQAGNRIATGNETGEVRLWNREVESPHWQNDFNQLSMQAQRAGE